MSGNTERAWPLIRYGEILLNYAEAITEAGQPLLAYPKLIELRNRAGILPGADNLYSLKPIMSVMEMREIVRNKEELKWLSRISVLMILEDGQ
ncbi:MAG: RagB/SusD family nutrient uptake outer membrane protein [Fimbriimonadaceae bacterium]|nr:RagB/SusD family nutrient uptake outer membrane protein [Chitinophagales bacterium]